MGHLTVLEGMRLIMYNIRIPLGTPVEPLWQILSQRLIPPTANAHYVEPLSFEHDLLNGLFPVVALALQVIVDSHPADLALGICYDEEDRIRLGHPVRCMVRMMNMEDFGAVSPLAQV